MGAKSAEVLLAIVDRVLVPAVTGGELVIERPFGLKNAQLAAEAVGGVDTGDGARQEIEHALGTTALERGEEAVVARLRRLCGGDAAMFRPRIEGGVVMLAALLHDVVAAFHPDLPAGPFRRRAPVELLEATARALASVPKPATLRAALLRHVWLGDALKFGLARSELRWWTGRASFVGRAPPSRLLAWPNLRRVRRDDRVVEVLRLPELFADRGDVSLLAEHHQQAMMAFFAASPLTDLALAGRLSPPFAWTESVAALVAHPAGARVARRAIALSEEGGKYAREVIGNVAGEAAAALG